MTPPPTCLPCKHYRYGFALVCVVLCGLVFQTSAEVVADPFDGGFTTESAAQRPRFLERIATGEPQTVMTYGTSLTAGGVWQRILETQLNRRYLGKVAFIVRGVPASCSGEGVPLCNDKGQNGLNEERLSEMLSHPADVYFVEFAINDAIPAYGISVEQSKSNHAKIFDRIEAASPGKKPEVILLKLSEPSLQGREKVWSKGVDAYFANYPEFAAARGYLYFDVCPPAMKLLANSPQTYKRLYPDGVHFNEEGAAFVADSLLRAWGEQPLDDDLAKHRTTR